MQPKRRVWAPKSSIQPVQKDAGQGGGDFSAWSWFQAVAL
jgi:hypothetical protein